MKNIVNQIIILFLGMLSFAACNSEILNLNPESAIGENGFYTNAGELEGAVVAIYDGWQAVPLREFALTEMRSSNTRTKSREGDWAQFEFFSVKPTNQAVGTYWTSNYNVIFRANRVLENLDVVGDASLKDQFEGEAKFSRALAHFNLVRAYGDVPILDKVIIQSDTEYFVRDEVNDVLSFIEADLEDATILLPGKANMSNGRATRGAAEALLAKVKLTKEDYTGAATLLGGLVNGTEYSLMAEYYDVFYNEMNDEILFAIPYKDDDANESQDFSFEMTAGGVVSGLNFVTNDFISNLDPAEDIRRPLLYDVNGVFPEVKKFVTKSSDGRLCGNDWIVLRLADVYLLHAEAVMAGNTETSNLDAIKSYNAVRTRAGMTTLPEDGSVKLTRDMLLYERRVELAFENHYLYDLIRFGVALEVLGDYASSIGQSFSPTDILLPIPQGEINVSGGALSQNPGYF